MTVRINKPALNLREELTKAQGVVRYEQRQFWYEGILENSSFDTDTDWIKSGTWAISNGQAVKSGTVSANLYQLNVTEDGKRYLVTINVVQNDGSVSFRTNNASDIVGDSITTTGSFSFVFTAIGTRLDVRAGFNTADIVVDDVKLFEVDENDNVIHSVPLGFKPVHVYEDGLLQREGDNHDYTVVDTGFGYQVKPTVAPSATTETCIIAEREL